MLPLPMSLSLQSLSCTYFSLLFHSFIVQCWLKFSKKKTECIRLYLIKLSSMIYYSEWVVVFYLVSNSCPLSKCSERKVRYLLISVSHVYLPITFKLNDHVSVTINQGLNMHSDYKILFSVLLRDILPFLTR